MLTQANTYVILKPSQLRLTIKKEFNNKTEINIQVKNYLSSVINDIFKI